MAEVMAKSGKEALTAVAYTAQREETIRKEDRAYRLFETYHVTPSLKHNITLCGTPTSVNVQHPADEPEDVEFKAMENAKRQKGEAPRTTNEEYGWDTVPLVPIRRGDIRFHHPKLRTDVTRLALMTAKTPAK